MKYGKLNLLVKGLLRLAGVFFAMSLLLFGSAGTFCFIPGWIAITAIVVPVSLLGVFLFFKNPDMLTNRLEGGEKVNHQKTITLIGAVIYASGLILAGLDYRNGISQIPLFFRYGSIVTYAFSCAVYFITFRQNKYLSRTVKIHDNQAVISNGIYGVVRHPFYLATTAMYFSIALILNSVLCLAAFFLLIPVLSKRIRYEEAFLEKNLNGYKEYKSKVKYKMIPYIW